MLNNARGNFFPQWACCIESCCSLHASFSVSLQPWPQEEVLLIKKKTLACPALPRFYPPISTPRTSIAAGISSLDQLRDAFRRRHGSSTSPMPSSAKVLARERGRSPGWLSRMHRNNSPSQRSASPATTRESSPAVQARRYPPQVDGAISSKSSTPELDLKHEIRPIMPAFLKLTHDGKIVFAPKSLELEPDFKCKKSLRSSSSLFALRGSA